jgi:hypothetical protein
LYDEAGLADPGTSPLNGGDDDSLDPLDTVRRLLLDLSDTASLAFFERGDVDEAEVAVLAAGFCGLREKRQSGRTVRSVRHVKDFALEQCEQTHQDTFVRVPRVLFLLSAHIQTSLLQAHVSISLQTAWIDRLA